MIETLLLAAAAGACPALRAGHDVLPVPSVPQPALHAPTKDPVFGTTVTRLTDPSQAAGVKYIRHYYAKTSPLNANDTRAIFLGSDGRLMLYDATSWKPIGTLKVNNSDPEAQWHPTQPDVFFYLDGVGGSPQVRGMYRYDLREDRGTLLHDFSEYETVRSRFEGNFDAAGRYYAMVGFREKKPVEALVYDVVDDTVIARAPVTEAMVADWISMSPSGKYVVMLGKDRTRIFDRQLRPLRELPPGSIGHGDICLLQDGSEAFVYDGADRQLDGNRNINIANLATGKETIGARIGWSSTPHVSCRNVDAPGWALVSTQGPDAKYPAHDFEIFWLKLDGSREVRRVAHHHSLRAKVGYYAEQHAVPNRKGDRILFASNWGGDTIAEYMVQAPENCAAR